MTPITTKSALCWALQSFLLIKIIKIKIYYKLLKNFSVFRISFERRNTTVNNFLIDSSIKKALIVILYLLLFVLGWIFLVVKLAFASELTKRFKIVKNGGAMRDRTADLLRARQALSQLSYSP